MDASPHRLEALGVGLYVPLVLVSGVAAVAALWIDAPFVGAFVAFWLVALCLLAALVAALVVLGVNARRAVNGVPADRRAVAFAAAIPVSLAVAVVALFAELSIEVTESVLVAAGIVALIVAPAGLFVTILGDSVRRQLWADP